MHRRTAKGNRVGLAVVGLIVLIAGAAILAAYYNIIPTGNRQFVYPRTLQRFVHDQRSWLWPVASAVAVVFAVLFLRWLVVQLRIDRIGRLIVDRDDSDTTSLGSGRTSMPSSAAADAIEDDVRELRGVRRVRADLAGNPDHPEVWLAVLTDADADLGRIRRVITEQVVPDARVSLGHDDLQVFIRLVVGRRFGGREVA